MNLTITFGLTTLALTGAVWHCYKANKPLRVKAREEAEAAAKKKAREEAEGREKDRRTNFRKELYSDLEQIIATPDMLIDHRYGSPFRGTGYRWKHLAEFIMKVKQNADLTQEVRNLNERVYAQGRTIRELQLQQKEILKALQMGQPVE
ncbi:DNA ligase [Pseudomonas phage vB_PpuP-Roomu-1]